MNRSSIIILGQGNVVSSGNNSNVTFFNLVNTLNGCTGCTGSTGSTGTTGSTGSTGTSSSLYIPFNSNGTAILDLINGTSGFVAIRLNRSAFGFPYSNNIIIADPTFPVNILRDLSIVSISAQFEFIANPDPIPLTNANITISAQLFKASTDPTVFNPIPDTQIIINTLTNSLTGNGVAPYVNFINLTNPISLAAGNKIIMLFSILNYVGVTNTVFDITCTGQAIFVPGLSLLRLNNNFEYFD